MGPAVVVETPAEFIQVIVGNCHYFLGKLIGLRVQLAISFATHSETSGSKTVPSGQY